MKPLSEKARKKKAVTEAKEHVRKNGLKNLEDVAFSIAVSWGFEEDENFIGWLIAFMQFTQSGIEAQRSSQFNKAAEAKYQKWKSERLKELRNPRRLGVGPLPREFEERLKLEQKYNPNDSDELKDKSE